MREKRLRSEIEGGGGFCVLRVRVVGLGGGGGRILGLGLIWHIQGIFGFEMRCYEYMSLFEVGIVSCRMDGYFV